MPPSLMWWGVFTLTDGAAPAAACNQLEHHTTNPVITNKYTNVRRLCIRPISFFFLPFWVSSAAAARFVIHNHFHVSLSLFFFHFSKGYCYSFLKMARRESNWYFPLFFWCACKTLCVGYIRVAWRCSSFLYSCVCDCQGGTTGCDYRRRE